MKIRICHRRPDRSFFIKNHQFPVCARCTGLFLSLLAIPIFEIIKLKITTYLFLSIVLIIPLFIDGTTQYFNKRESNNILRCITGFIGGIGICCFSIFIMMFFLPQYL